MRTNVRKRYFILVVSVFALFVTGWLELFLQRKQHLIGGGINRAFLFLLINAHLIVSIILLYLIIRQSIKLAVERRNKVPGSAFKRNLFFAFIIFSVIPVVFVFFVAGKLITASIDNWFQVHLGTGLENSLYLHEQQTQQERSSLIKIMDSTAQQVQADFQKKKSITKSLIDEIRKTDSEVAKYRIYIWGERGSKIVGSIRDEVHVWRSFRKVNDRTTKSLREKLFEKLYGGTSKPFDFYGSLYYAKKIDSEKPMYLVIVYRYPENIRYPLIEIQNSIGDYEQLKGMHNPIRWNYFLTFLLITLLILFLSIWCAFRLARGISEPIKELLLAIKKMRRGDLDVSVKIQPTNDLNLLVSGFNEMTASLQHAYKQLTFHNKEMLTMLEHIKESVFFVNNVGRILSFNAAASRLVEKYLKLTRLKKKKVSFFGSYAKDLFFALVRELKDSEKSYISKEVSFSHEGEEKILLVYLTVVQNSFVAKNNGVLVILEDLSEVYKVNKIKTWQEAAKQMAHEVKNPLTPIQLATQRLQRKLRKRGDDDPVLMECTETILHQVKIIKNLISHFSEFAKMPGTIIETLDINEIIRETTSLYEMSYPDISFSYELKEFLPGFKADKKKIKRVIVNLLDNSVRALQKISDSNVKKEIMIKTSFKTGRNQIELVISDNGPGIPKHIQEKLFLPYVSTNNKNMGLGLAIVHDIVLQFGGSVKFIPSSQGAMFQILLPV